jgi:hypothetical protein
MASVLDAGSTPARSTVSLNLETDMDLTPAEHLLDLINKDLDLYEEGWSDHEVFYVLLPHPEVGTIVPFNWLENYGELQDAWGKFIDGQSVCLDGFYVSDVKRFLHSKIRRREE